MKMQRITLTFERTMTVVVYAPADLTDDVLVDIANETAQSGLDGWDPPDWEASVGASTIVDVPADERTLDPPNKYGFQNVVEGSRLGREDTLVVNDARTDIVSTEDATWWLASAVERLVT